MQAITRSRNGEPVSRKEVLDDAPVPISKPYINDLEAEAVVRALQSGWITQGPEVAAFEKEFALFTGAAHACAVSNCTNALHLALLAVGVQPGDEVITVSHSFIATANSIRYCGATPVFIDIEPETFNLNCSLIEGAVTAKTSAILCVHQMGMPCHLPELLAVAARHGLRVIEDAACASGTEIEINGRWERVGKPHADIACFSFHPRKVITTGDGGIITTNNSHWDAQLRLMRQHGMSVPDTVRHSAPTVIFESYSTVGYNYRMTDIQAAVGRAQLAKLPEIVERRRRLADRYQVLLQDIQELILPADGGWTRSNWQSYCVRLPPQVPQQRIMQSMLEAGIATRRGIMCAHREPAYQNQGPSLGRKGSTLIQSERAQDEAILLPMFAQMTDAEQDRVVICLGSAIQRERDRNC